MPNVDLAVLPNLRGIGVHPSRRRPADILAVYIVDPAVARTKKLSLALLRDPTNRTAQVRAGATENVEGALNLLNLLLRERPSVVVIKKGGTPALPIGTVGENLCAPRDPNGALHHELFGREAALLLERPIPVGLINREVHPEGYRLLLQVGYRPDLEPVVGSVRNIRLSEYICVDDRPEDERRRRDGQDRPGYRPQDPETQKVFTGHGIFL